MVSDGARPRVRDHGADDAAGGARVARIPDAAPISRTLRFLTGVGLLAWVLPRVIGASPDNQVRVWGVVLALTVLYVGVHWLIDRHFRGLHPWIGALVAAGPIAVALAMGPIASAGAILYVGLSLVVVAVRAEPGCEVFAVPALIFCRPTHLACLVFSPLDWIEGKLGARMQR